MTGYKYGASASKKNKVAANQISSVTDPPLYSLAGRTHPPASLRFN